MTSGADNAPTARVEPVTDTGRSATSASSTQGAAADARVPESGAGAGDRALDERLAGEEGRASDREAGAELSDAELAQIRELAARDREVRNHEAAHAAAGGGLTGSPTYSFTRGPDGRLYATGGEVRIESAAVPGDPQATIDRARTVIQAATAPANPSPQDLRAAAEARALLADAQAELAQVSAEERREAGGSETSEDSGAVRDGSSSDFERQRVEAEERAARREELNDAAAERLERTRESLEDFADQLDDLNDRLADLQRQINSTGAITPERAIGALLDISV